MSKNAEIRLVGQPVLGQVLGMVDMGCSDGWRGSTKATGITSQNVNASVHLAITISRSNCGPNLYFDRQFKTLFV